MFADVVAVDPVVTDGSVKDEQVTLFWPSIEAGCSSDLGVGEFWAMDFRAVFYCEGLLGQVLQLTQAHARKIPLPANASFSRHCCA